MPWEAAASLVLGVHVEPPALPRGPDALWLVAGDLNVTPWSTAFGRMARTGSLADVSLGRGIHPTWFSRFPFMGLPIDHVLVNPGFRAAEVEVLPSIGSDHFPLLASLAFAPKATQ